MLNDTICAISTSLANGAIAIVRMSGEESFNIIKDIAHLSDDKIKANHLIYAHIYEDDEVIDEVLISFFYASHSYTREDIVEINCHGGVYITRKILNLLIQKGARLAENGEFTKRAYLNGRIDLSNAEAINDLINANNRYQAKSAIKGIDGSIQRLLEPLLNDMKNVLAMIEVNIDYPEYEDEVDMSQNKIKPYLLKWTASFKEMIDKAERFRVVKDGLKTVIIGKPNVGKSSLLNALLEKEKAIVTDVAGTTRDLVEGHVNLKNTSLHLIDTAGIRESEDIVEKIGIEKSKEALKEADLVILVLDASKDLEAIDEELLELSKDKRRIIVYNKADIKGHEGISISAMNRDIKPLTDAIDKMFEEDVILADEDVLNNERQIALMKRALIEIDIALKDIEDTPIDVIYTSIMESYHYLSDILGREYREDLIDHMFKNFCLGK